jgi:hypothetical protein
MKKAIGWSLGNYQKKLHTLILIGRLAVTGFLPILVFTSS